MNIPLVDLTIKNKTERGNILKKIQQVITKSNFILGEEILSFEKEFAAYIGTKYCVGVASGTDALFLSLKALGIGEGDEVIVPAMTFMATASAVSHAGAKPVFVDISPSQPTIDASKIEKKITKRTKAIIPVHLYGYPSSMDKLEIIAKKYKLALIEDACQSHGSTFYGKKTGSIGDISAFSFYPSKNLGAFGDAGAITTSNKKLYETILSLRNHGQYGKNTHNLLGYNSRMDTIQAAVLSIKLQSLDKANKKRNKHAALYTKLLQDLPITLPTETENYTSNYHIYAIQTAKRNELMNYLNDKGISCGIHYSLPLHLQPAFTFLEYKKGDFPYAEALAEKTLSLPMYPELTQKQIKYIVKMIHTFFN